MVVLKTAVYRCACGTGLKNSPGALQHRGLFEKQRCLKLPAQKPVCRKKTELT